MHRTSWLLILGMSATAACARARLPAVDTSAAARATLASADALVRAGCFDCLASALAQYESIRRVPAVGELATAGAVRASALLALRERELGTTDSGYLEKARELAVTSAAGQDVAPLLDVVGVMPWRAGAGRLGSPDNPPGLFRNDTARVELLRSLAARDELAAYVWLAYACQTRSVGADRNALIAPIDARRPTATVAPGPMSPMSPMSDAPLLVFKQAICLGVDPKLVDALSEREPRFAELAFFRGLIATGSRKLDEAEEKYLSAYAWRSTWPAVTIALGNLALTAEEFSSAVDFYDKTLTFTPLYPDALLGKLRALTYLARHDEAISVAGELLAIGRYPGDAYYWRASNELQLDRLDRAWDDIEAADKVMINSDVPKVAGLIGIRRRALDIARQKLELAHQRNPPDCETSYYLHLVLADQAHWADVVEIAVGTAGCLDDAEAYARQDVDRIAASSAPDARKARQIARRQQQIASAVRMRATCRFNAAVASFNLSKPAEARRFAEQVSTDEQFGERARDLLTRLAPSR